MNGIAAYQHLIGKKVRFQVGETIVSSVPGKEEFCALSKSETVVALSSVASADGTVLCEYVVTESGYRLPLDKVFIETILFGQHKEAI